VNTTNFPKRAQSDSLSLFSKYQGIKPRRRGAMNGDQEFIPPEHTTEKCMLCHAVLTVKVCKSAAGYYIGTCCNNCGPHNRFSGYTRKREQADKVLKAFLDNPCPLRSYFLTGGELTSVHWLCCKEPSGELSERHYSTLRTAFPAAKQAVRE
jgi:hypothetical protein